MSFFSKLISVTQNPIKEIGAAANELFTSDKERKQLDNDLAEIEQKPHLMQAIANVVAAKHRSIFVAGGRPALLWVAAMGLFFFFPVKYAVGTIIWAKHSWVTEKVVEFPFTGNGLMELVSMLLGLGLYRTIEKLTGKAK